jgi:23S rRNA pseudouridine2605 synthase
MKPRNQANERQAGGQRVGLARALSKLGFCSRQQAWRLIEAGNVTVNGKVIRHPEQGVDWQRARIEVAGESLQAAGRVYLMLNKPRGLVTTADDEQGRATVYTCLANAELPFVSPVGRLDKASEGLLLFTNDTAWADRITSPTGHVEKTYHVQVNGLVEDSLLGRMRAGVSSGDESLRVREVVRLRAGQKNCWLEIVLEEGRNRHIRRLMDGLGLMVLRLIRISIGPLRLGNLPKGQWRFLEKEEVVALRSAKGRC